jgi:polyhydroxybutyrate depolymerase
MRSTGSAAKVLIGALVAAATIAAVPAPATAAEPGCTLAPTGGTVSKSLNGRSYLVNVPADLAASEVPLLLSLHGFGSNGSQDETFTGWTPFAAARGFIVAYPQGRPSQSSGAWDPYSAASEDVGFLRDVVADISKTWCVNPRRVHADGWSNGAVMSQRLACSSADVFASVTSYGGGTPTVGGFATPCRPSRPISVGLFAGEWDFTYAGVAQNAWEWRAVNGCAPTPTHTTDAYGSTDAYACAGGTTVLARVVKATSHNWPSGAQGEDQRARMWAFKSANPRP